MAIIWIDEQGKLKGKIKIERKGKEKEKMKAERDIEKKRTSKRCMVVVLDRTGNERVNEACSVRRGGERNNIRTMGKYAGRKVSRKKEGRKRKGNKELQYVGGKRGRRKRTQRCDWEWQRKTEERDRGEVNGGERRRRETEERITCLAWDIDRGIK
ncbi:hypothetical protein Hamer_G014107 [Homarus americanus]|uniref:Uncharacterized protein n=1 Tax=Homarus americanus TaxID=6706 RepID=A0A8J5JPF7_HOMAM|nr:hypothetical protein Hamer_G014107 [Homarus americanus]